MSNRFLLFGEKPFEVYAREKFSEVVTGIELMNDVELLMFRDDFDGLVKKTCEFYSFPSLEISFEEKVVDLIAKSDRGRPRFFAEYSLVVKGETYFLGLSPYGSGFRAMNLWTDLKENVLVFVIDTRYHSEELTAEVTEHVRSEYMRIKTYIQDTQDNLNKTISYYNGELEKLVIKQLANRMRKAVRCARIRESLNFK